jgi:hypothetical protein
VGLGIENLLIPQKFIWSEEKAQDKYFKLDSQKNLGIKNAEKDLIYWIFPLDSLEPWGAVMILGASESSDFNPGPVSAILDDEADKMVFAISKEAAESGSGEITLEFSSMESFDYQKSNKVEKEIALFHRIYLDFSCIVLENPAAEAEDNSPTKTSFCEKVSAMIDKAGTVIPLASGRPLILFPIVIDRELIAHRLSKTLNTKLLLSFEANNPENVFTRIDSLI